MTQQIERLRTTIVETAEMTCETLVFLFPAPEPEEDQGPDGENHDGLLHVSVRFAGPFEGSMTLTMPREMLPTVAANMLGLDEDATGPGEWVDASRELCNVICGNLLPAVAGTEPVFVVSSPQLSDEPPRADLTKSVSARAWFEEGWVEVQLMVDGGLVLLDCGTDPEALRTVV